LRVEWSIAATPSKPIPSSRGSEGGSGTPEIPEVALPLISAKTPLGDDDPLVTTKSKVLVPAMNPLVMENAVREPKPANVVQSPVFAPLRKMQALLSDVHEPDNCAVAGSRPIRLKEV
jgi:hypothetical protein